MVFIELIYHSKMTIWIIAYQNLTLIRILNKIIWLSFKIQNTFQIDKSFGLLCPQNLAFALLVIDISFFHLWLLFVRGADIPWSRLVKIFIAERTLPPEFKINVSVCFLFSSKNHILIHLGWIFYVRNPG